MLPSVPQLFRLVETLMVEQLLLPGHVHVHVHVYMCLSVLGPLCVCTCLCVCVCLLIIPDVPAHLSVPLWASPYLPLPPPLLPSAFSSAFILGALTQCGSMHPLTGSFLSLVGSRGIPTLCLTLAGGSGAREVGWEQPWIHTHCLEGQMREQVQEDLSPRELEQRVREGSPNEEPRGS